MNDKSTNNFHNNTNKKPDEYLNQLILKMNRDDIHKYELSL